MEWTGIVTTLQRHKVSVIPFSCRGYNQGKTPQHFQEVGNGMTCDEGNQTHSMTEASRGAVLCCGNGNWEQSPHHHEHQHRYGYVQWSERRSGTHLGGSTGGGSEWGNVSARDAISTKLHTYQDGLNSGGPTGRTGGEHNSIVPNHMNGGSCNTESGESSIGKWHWTYHMCLRTIEHRARQLNTYGRT